ncbi:MAG: hypothetical protein QOH49_4261 [Acidobacteriota bacterium]|nr:hypothetical protein [Acidobacteriota bacterium]
MRASAKPNSRLGTYTAFTLLDNTVFVENSRQLTAVSADPNYFDPTTGNLPPRGLIVLLPVMLRHRH